MNSEFAYSVNHLSDSWSASFGSMLLCSFWNRYRIDAYSGNWANSYYSSLVFSNDI